MEKRLSSPVQPYASKKLGTVKEKNETTQINPPPEVLNFDALPFFDFDALHLDPGL